MIGITGGICSGKSTVTRVLKDAGVHILDADKLGHKAYEPGTSCFNKLVQHFGESIVDEKKEIDRRVLGSIVFSDPSKMQELQSIVWPEIRGLIISNLDELKAQDVRTVALEAAVMIEAGWYDLVSTLWVVTVKRDVALKRLMARNGLSEEEALKRIDAQISNEERCDHADLVIDNSNDNSMEALEEKVRSAYDNMVR